MPATKPWTAPPKRLQLVMLAMRKATSPRTARLAPPLVPVGLPVPAQRLATDATNPVTSHVTARRMAVFKALSATSAVRLGTSHATALQVVLQVLQVAATKLAAVVMVELAELAALVAALEAVQDLDVVNHTRLSATLVVGTGI
jgi:hypothetical protein